MNVSFHEQARKIYKLCFEECRNCVIRVKTGQNACDTCLELNDECPARSVMRYIDSQYVANGDIVKLHGMKNIQNGSVRVTVTEEDL